VPYDPVHAPRNAEEVDEECPGHPNPAVMEQGLPFDDPLDAEGDGDEKDDDEQDDLDAEGRMMGPTSRPVRDSTNSAMESARRAKSD
jgi:hypothetical protein